MRIRAKNWNQFQHYNRRNPPWIKLHRNLLDNYDFQRLPVASVALAPLLWLLASESDDGSVDADPDYLEFRLRWPKSLVWEGLKPLIDNCFFSGDSSTLAERYQGATPETEAEREIEGEGEREARAGTRDAPAREEPEPKPKPRPDKNRVDRPGWIDEQVWSDMLKLRRGHKATLTPTAWKKIRAQLEAGIEKGYDPNDMIAEWLDAGWRSFKLEWYENRLQKQGGQGGDSVDQQVRAAREYRERQKRLIEGEATNERQ